MHKPVLQQTFGEGAPGRLLSEDRRCGTLLGMTVSVC